MNVISPKKLIEVALPLDKINEAAAATKRKAPKGYPTTLHNWWAQRPLAAARAVIFGQLVHDPEDLWRCQNPGREPVPQQRAAWTKARARLFRIIEDLVRWENTTNEVVLNAARNAIQESWRQTCELNRNHPRAKELFDPDRMPGFHDPFAGSGAIPLEAQRLGLQSFASDLNPVAVLINKAMIELPPRFGGASPVNPEWQLKSSEEKAANPWRGAHGLAADVRFYGQWIRDELEKRIGHLYPKVEVTAAMANARPDLKLLVGKHLTVIAWLWARTVRSPNPAFAHIQVPLASTFILSSKAGKEAYVQPILDTDGYRFTVRMGAPPPAAKSGTKSGGSHSSHLCLMSKVPISFEYLRAQSKTHGLGTRLMAIVAEGPRGRIYLTPEPAHEQAANDARPGWRPEVEISHWPGRTNVVEYGLTHFGQLFTQRQLAALTTLSELIVEGRERVYNDAVSSGLPDDNRPLDEGGAGARAYAETVSVYLAFALSRVADYGSTISTWRPKDNAMRSTFSKQAIPMTWDFAEGSPLAKSSAGFVESIAVVASVIPFLPASLAGHVEQADAQRQEITSGSFVSTDPPYYSNIGYADLSDYFYVWLRRTLRAVFPRLLSTIAVPKAEELVATPYRHGTKEKAEAFFLEGMTQAMRSLALQCHPAAPCTIYYAYKQAETESEGGTSSSGWETFLDAVLKAGLSITGTWPVRTEGDNRQIGIASNALASSVVLVCRSRTNNAGVISRRQFVRLLNEALPLALDAMTRESEGLHSPVEPVDLSQAIIGPGMAIFSRYGAVLEADGSPMSVKTALELINRFLAEDDFDSDTQFCLHWFEQHGWNAGSFGEADTLARAKGTSVDGVKHSGVLESGKNKARLLRWKEYPADWDPESDSRLPVWEVLHQLIRSYSTQGDSGAGALLAATVSKAEAARQLAYRLYTLCERKGWAEDARAYNEVVTGWSGIESAAAKVPGPKQTKLFED